VSVNDTYEEPPDHPITLRVAAHPAVASTRQDDVIVFAIRNQLLVRAGAVTALGSDLSRIAEPVASLTGSVPGAEGYATPDDPQRREPSGGDAAPDQPAAIERFDLGDDDVQLWVLREGGDDVFDVVRNLNTKVDTVDVGSAHEVPAVSPNHLCVVAKPNICPAGPPRPIPPPPNARNFVEPYGPRETIAHVTVIDTGYIDAHPRHHELDRRVDSVAGRWFNWLTRQWEWCPPDVRSINGYELDGVAGHGTFIAGLIAHQCRRCRITVVGQRHDVVWVGPNPGPAQQAMLFSTEFDVANALLLHADADVVSCGFAFPTLGGLSSIAFSYAMAAIMAKTPDIAVCAPAGNEDTAQAYWPAAHPDVIGVAATNRLGNARAWFSNWGTWANVCTRGEDVWSTYVDWTGQVEGYPSYETMRFERWASWDGTSFATPRVAGAIARHATATGRSPRAAYDDLIAAAALLPSRLGATPPVGLYNLDIH
jgi:subtilisin family serine protease